MKLRALALFLCLWSLATAHAQVGIYGKFDALRYSSTPLAAVPATTTWFYGPGIGAYYDFMHLGPVSLGADLRGDLLNTTQSRYRSALFGLRLSAKPPVLSIRPYVQGSVGAGGSRYTGPLGAGISPSGYSTKFQYQIAGGVDFTIHPHLDFRAAEIAYGRMSGVSSFAAAPAVNLLTISSGFVFRFP